MIWVWSVVLRDKNETSMFQDEVSSDDIYRRPKRGKAAKTTCLLLKRFERQKSESINLHKVAYIARYPRVGLMGKSQSCRTVS